MRSIGEFLKLRMRPPLLIKLDRLFSRWKDFVEGRDDIRDHLNDMLTEVLNPCRRLSKSLS